jgi:hypothetical protein
MKETRLPSFNDFSPIIINRDIAQCLKVIKKHNGDRKAIINEWAQIYFKGVSNKRSSANIPATLKSTGLTEGKDPIKLTDLAESIIKATTASEGAAIFCKHLYQNKNANLLVEAIKQLNAESKKPTKENLKKELVKLGIKKLSSATTDHTTLLNWFIFAGIINADFTINDRALKDTMGVTSAEIDLLQELTEGQKYFVYCLRKRHEMEEGPFAVTELLSECIHKYPHLYDDDQFAKKIRNPLIAAGLVEVNGLAKGAHGGRSGKITASTKLLEIPVEEFIPSFDSAIPTDLKPLLKTPLDRIEKDLKGSDKYKGGIALELLSLKIIQDLSLVPRGFRLRSSQTAYAEVDLIAEGDHLMFSRWAFQCKRHIHNSSSKVTLSDVAKEVGIAVHAKAHVVVVITTGEFTQDAREYANEVSKATHLQFALVNGQVVNRYLKVGLKAIIEFFQNNAKEVMKLKGEQPLPGNK